MFKRAISYLTRNDSDLAEQAVNFGQQHEFADIAWHPGHGKVLYRLDNRVPVNVSGDGVYNFIGFRPTATAVILANRLAGGYSPAFYLLFCLICVPINQQQSFYILKFIQLISPLTLT